MSGYFGVVRLDGKPIEAKLLERAATKLRFRGPDQTTVWAGEEIGGCFTFFETGPAKQSRVQPVGLGERYKLWGDVRLDGRQELLRRVTEKGDPGAAELTSEELLMRAWALWGEECLTELIGDYSFALWDAQEKRLWCARDFVGARPFFYAHTAKVLYFSNALETLRGLPEISEALDEEYVADFLLEGFSQEPSRTVYQQIRRLPAGHRLKFSNGEVNVRRFLTLPVEEPLRLKRSEEYVEAYREKLQAAVQE